MPPADPGQDRPLSDEDLQALLASFADARLIALAVSGGADSLGLMAAVARWRPPALSVLVLTVDHRLQRGSGRVARDVVAMAERLQFEARVLVRKGPAPTADIEAEARAARYRLLIGACREAGASHLLLAHQRDDVAENFLLRLKRGSGVFGLAAMRPAIDLGGVVVARPFLAVSRARLAATARTAGLEPIEDAMNADPRFDRVRVRQLLPRLADLGLDAAALSATAGRLADAADAIEQAASTFLTQSVEADRCAVAWLDVAGFASASRAVRLRALARIVMAVGGGDYPPRHDRLAALHDGIMERPPGLKRTLAGTVAFAHGDRVAFFREAGRAGLPSVALRPGASGVFDHRFAYAVAADAPVGLTLAPVRLGGASGPPMAAIPTAARAVLPAVFRRGKALAPSPIAERFPSDSRGFVAIRSILRERLDRPPAFPGDFPFTLRENGGFA